MANGSEVSLCCDGAELLAKDGIKARVVSVPSIGLFNEQPAEYRHALIPPHARVMGWTAGLPCVIRSIRDWQGPVYGLERFGASAPYKVLDQKFGFTPENVVAEVKAYLGK